MIIQFNWYELTQTTKLAESQVILMFCLYINKHKPLVKRISSSHVMLRKKLNIGNNYYGLLHSKLIVDSKNGIFSNFYCKEPQNYLTNCSFLHSKVSAQKKADYMYILGQRSLNNFNNNPVAKPINTTKKPEAPKPPQPPTGDDFFSSFGV